MSWRNELCTKQVLTFAGHKIRHVSLHKMTPSHPIAQSICTRSKGRAPHIAAHRLSAGLREAKSKVRSMRRGRTPPSLPAPPASQAQREMIEKSSSLLICFTRTSTNIIHTVLLHQQLKLFIWNQNSLTVNHKQSTVQGPNCNPTVRPVSQWDNSQCVTGSTLEKRCALLTSLSVSSWNKNHSKCVTKVPLAIEAGQDMRNTSLWATYTPASHRVHSGRSFKQRTKGSAEQAVCCASIYYPRYEVCRAS